jgi:molybdenum cofactor cytidylyltransferase
MRAERSGPVAGVVLAAGTSSRMGENKLLFRVEGETLVRRAVQTAVSAGLEPVIVVLGHEAERAVAELSGLEIEPVFNDEYARGIHTSLRAGIAVVPASSCAAVVILADMPFVTATMITRILEQYRDSPALAVVSDYAGVQAPPTLYDRAFFPELAAVKGEGCGKQVLRRHENETSAVSWPAAALTDVDRPEDYERVAARLGGKEIPCATTS